MLDIGGIEDDFLVKSEPDVLYLNDETDEVATDGVIPQAHTAIHDLHREVPNEPETPKPKQHQLTYTQDKPNSCSLCNRTYTKYSNLKRHIRTQHKVVFYCKICYKAFAKRSNRDEHQISHGMIENIEWKKCLMCLNWFSIGGIVNHLWKCKVKRPCLNRIYFDKVWPSGKSSAENFTILITGNSRLRVVPK